MEFSTNREDRLMDLGAEIRRKEAEISDLRREFQRLLVQNDGQSVPIPTVDGVGLPLPGSMAAMTIMVNAQQKLSLPKKLLARMQASPDSDFRAENFLGIGGADDIQNVRTSLVRLCDRDGLVERVDRGVYRLRRGSVQ